MSPSKQALYSFPLLIYRECFILPASVYLLSTLIKLHLLLYILL